MEETRPGYKLIATLPGGEEVRGIVVHNGEVLVALSCGLYRLRDDHLEPVPFGEPVSYTENPSEVWV